MNEDDFLTISDKVGEGFYGGEEVDESILLEHMARAVSMNLEGEEAVTVAIEHKTEMLEKWNALYAETR